MSRVDPFDVPRTSTIEQTIEFPRVPAGALFETYVDAKAHAAAIGAPASIEPRAGGAFRAFGDGGLVGTVLHVVPDRMVVQTWRAQSRWRETELDSILVLRFETTPDGGRVVLVHSGVPERDVDLFRQGWHERYWTPWRAYFAAQRS